MKDLERLKNEITFASNKIYLAFDQTDWRPTYFAAEDRTFLQNNHEVVSKITGFPKFFPRRNESTFPKIKHGIYFRRIVEENFYPDEPGFGLNPITNFYWGHTITYTLIQFACYMRIRKIYLLGIDMDYKVQKGYERGKEPYIAQSNDNYFHPNYLMPGDMARRPNLHMQSKSYEKAGKKMAEFGGYIYNATRGGKLEIFPRVDFDSLFEN